MQGNAVLFLLAGLLVARSTNAARFQMPSGVLGHQEHLPVPPLIANVSTSASLRPGGPVVVKDDPMQLELCDCTFATGEPDGLSCEGEGYFITGFERQGTWMAGGGLVPLSRASCCRPCLPSDLPDAVRSSPDERPAAIVSLGCHSSSNTGPLALSCESGGSAVVAGFTSAQVVSSFYLDVYYPLGAASCCNPALLTSTGDLLRLKRCDCGETDEEAKECGGGDGSGRLLWGFSDARLAETLYVPVAPLQCCGLCLGERLPGGGDCAELNYCSGNGVCSLGACECSPGYGGADCSLLAGNLADMLPWWGWMIVVPGMVLLLGFALTGLRSLYVTLGDGPASGRGPGGPQSAAAAAAARAALDEQRHPLLLPADDALSAGSMDTAAEEEEDEEVEGEADHGDDDDVGEGDETGAAPGDVEDGRRRRPSAAPGDQAATSGSAAADDNNAGDNNDNDGSSDEDVPPVASGDEEDEGRRRLLGGGQDNEEKEAVEEEVGRRSLQDVETGSGNGASTSAAAAAAAAAACAEISSRPAAEEGSVGSDRSDDDDEEMGGTAVGRRGSGSVACSSSSSRPPVDAARRPHGDEAEDKGEGDDDDDVKKKKGLLQHGGLPEPLQGAACAVCLERCVQVVLVPCGHTNLCRRCSRRMDKCPFCRQIIVRRQRLFAT